MSAAHAKHILARGSGGYGYGCQVCHWAVTQDGTTILASSTKHVDGSKVDVAWLTTTFTPAGATWGGGTSTSNHTCAGLYCHGSMPKGGLAATPAWTSGSVPCGSCHNLPPAGDGTHGTGDTDCNSCHPGYSISPSYVVSMATHVNGSVQNSGGTCIGCHTGTQNRADVPGARRAVVADFSKNSHHVFSSALTGTNKLTDNDCAVCHAEAVVTAPGGKVAYGPLHFNGMIDLRNADDVNAYFQYDKRAICIGSGGSATQCDTPPTAADQVPWTQANAAKWSSGLVDWRNETSGRVAGDVGAADACTPAATGCSKGLDRFCISCHDADGASASYTKGELGAGPQNPFNDSALTNPYDQKVRPSITDIASRVHVTARLPGGGSATLKDRDIGARGPDTRMDPPEGVFSRHAIRGLATPVYAGTNANWDVATYWTLIPTTTTRWASNSVMGCADCHAVDGANGGNGNAHGSGGEYLLKDAAGGATEPATDAYTAYVCARCHDGVWYDGGHTASTQDWVDTAYQIGANRIPVAKSGGNVFGYPCGNCHGGGAPSRAGATLPPDSAGAGGFGTIHGTSQVIGIGTDGLLGYRNTYRFTNGNSMRYYNPGDWTTSASRTCVTLSAGDAAWGGCLQHSGSGSSRSPTTPSIRPLSY